MPYFNKGADYLDFTFPVAHFVYPRLYIILTGVAKFGGYTLECLLRLTNCVKGSVIYDDFTYSILCKQYFISCFQIEKPTNLNRHSNLTC